MKINEFEISLEKLEGAAYHFSQAMVWVYEPHVKRLRELIERAKIAGLIKEDEEWEEEV